MPSNGAWRASAALLLLALGCGDDPVLVTQPDPAFPSPSPQHPVEIRMLSGDGQVGMAGDVLADPLTARVTDGNGHAIPFFPVTWKVISGGGAGFPAHTRTGAAGVAEKQFMPTVLGPSIVMARVITATHRDSVLFTAEASGVLIRLAEAGWDGVEFMGPEGTSDVTVPVGTRVEWLNVERSARIASSGSPTNGATFDSGPLGPNQRFAFTPQVEGTWTYADQVSGATGALTATARE